MPDKVHIFECKQCGTEFRKAEIDPFDLPEDWWPSLCVKCRSLGHLNNYLAERHFPQPKPFGSPPEERLWHAISDEFKQDEIHIFNQVPTIYEYTLDFYFAEFRLAVEMDGKAFHDSLRDAHRDDVHRREYGIETLRFSAREVSDDMPGVLSRIRAGIQQRDRIAFPAKRLAEPADGTDRITEFL